MNAEIKAIAATAAKHGYRLVSGRTWTLDDALKIARILFYIGVILFMGGLIYHLEDGVGLVVRLFIETGEFK